MGILCEPDYIIQVGTSKYVYLVAKLKKSWEGKYKVDLLKSMWLV